MSVLKEIVKKVRERSALTLQEVSSLVQMIRDNPEEMHRVEFEQNMEIIPWLCKLLDSDIPPTLACDSLEHKVRQQVLGVVTRLPTKEHMSAYIPQLLRSVTKAATVDNEDNALLALKYMVQLHKTCIKFADCRAVLEEQAQEFLKFAKVVLGSMSEAVSVLVNEGWDSSAFTAAAYVGAADFAPGTGVTAPVTLGLAALREGKVPRSGGGGGGAPASAPPAPGETQIAAVACGLSLCPSRLSFRVVHEVEHLMCFLFLNYAHLLIEHLPSICSAMLAFVRIFPIKDAESLEGGHLPSTACAAATASSFGSAAAAAIEAARATGGGGGGGGSHRRPSKDGGRGGEAL